MKTKSMITGSNPSLYVSVRPDGTLMYRNIRESRAAVVLALTSYFTSEGSLAMRELYAKGYRIKKVEVELSR